jgi:mono/diheme cytochrome c family protein
MARTFPHLQNRLIFLAGLALLRSSPAGLAQAGDKAGEVQPKVDQRYAVPPAPPLDPVQALASFQLQDGYRIECAASEPLINDPVDLCWDAQGRMWVVEMTGLMPDADGTGELDAVCSIAILSDQDADGVFDHRQEFLRDLVLPRSVCLVPGGVLVLAPPQLRFYPESDPAHSVVVAEGFEAGLSNPEHAANSMVLGLDNWVYLANHNRRYRIGPEGWQIEAVPQTGQWGLGEDDWGRRCYNYNSTPVRGDLLPTHYLLRNPNLGRAQGSNVPIATQTAVWSSRLNTGVNRGYRKGTLREDGFLANYTAACGPDFFRGTLLRPQDRGDIFVAEPAANLVRQLDVQEDRARLRGENAYAAQQQEFLTSSDERFRPVNLRNGPDGALYVVDLYRGILQHRVFMTSFLRRQVELRGLDQPIGLGRIWRIVRDDAPEVPAAIPNLRKLSPRNLVAQLYEPNAWNRRMAQMLLIEFGLSDSTPAASRKEIVQLLQQVAASTGTALTRSHALWTLQGMQALSVEFIRQRLQQEAHAKVLAQLIRLSENHAAEPAIFESWQALALRPEREIRWQLACSLGESLHPASMHLMVGLLAADPADEILRQSVISGLANRETEFFQFLSRTPAFEQPNKNHLALFRLLGTCVARGADFTQLEQAWKRCQRYRHNWIAREFLQGMIAGLPKKPDNPRYRFKQRRPEALLALMTSENLELGQLAQKVAAPFRWNFNPENAELNKLPMPHRASIARGKTTFALACSPCHQNDGLGLAGLAPPLADSEWLNRSDAELANIALFGLSGEIQVKGQNWNLTMPGWAHLPDQQLADVLTYVLHQWGPEARHVLSTTVQKARNP